MREQVKIPLQADEYQALAKLAEHERRPVSMQAEYLIVEALRSYGLLPPSSHDTTASALREVTHASR